MQTTTAAFDWTAVAQAWGSHRDHVEGMKQQVTEDLLAALQLRPGQRVLELGAGTGDLALRLAAAVGPTGHVIASDVAAGMVALLRDTLATASNTEVAQLEARDTGLPSASVDAVVMRMGLMLVDDPGAVLREAARVLAPGGRLAVAVWAAPQHNPWILYIGMAAQINGVVTGGPPTGPGGLFSLADPDALLAAIRTAGFADATLAEASTNSVFASVDEYFDTVTSLAGPLSLAIAAASDETRAAMRRTAGDLAAAHRTPNGMTLAGRALVCSGTAG